MKRNQTRTDSVEYHHFGPTAMPSFYINIVPCSTNMREHSASSNLMCRSVATAWSGCSVHALAYLRCYVQAW